MNEFDELIDLAKSNVRAMVANDSASRMERFRTAFTPKLKFNDPKSKPTPKKPAKVGAGSMTLREMYEKTKNQGAEKSIATESAPATDVKVRSYKRVMMAKKQATRVRAFQRRRFKDAAQVPGVKNVGE